MCDGESYREFPTRDIRQFAKENNLVIIYGASDDLCEVDGALWEEFGVGENTDFKEWDDELYSDKQVEVMEFLKKIGLKQNWYPEDDITWKMSVDEYQEHENFTLTDGDERNIGVIVPLK